MFGWLEGERLAEEMSEANVEALGAATAELHRHARTFPTPAGMKVWDSPLPFLDPEVLFSQEHAVVLDAAGREPYERARTATAEAIERLAATEAPRMIHADLHEDNVFLRPDGSLAVLDFDDCMTGWPVQDLGITAFSLASMDRWESLQAALRRGYERVAPWSERRPGEVRVFAADRCLMHANYIVQDHDPEYLVKAPEFVARWAERIELLLG